MPIQNNATNEEMRKAEVECLRKVLAEKDKEIKISNEIISTLRRDIEYLEDKLNKLESYR